MDYEKLASACGMTNPRSASNAWSSIKKKLFASVPQAEKPGKAGKTNTPRKRKNKAVEEEDADGADATITSGAQKSSDDEGGDEQNEADLTPAKKKRATPAKKAAAKKVKNEGGSDAEEPKPKQMAKRPKTPKAAKAAQMPKDEPTSDNDDAAMGASVVPAVVLNDEQAEEEDVEGAV